MAGDDRGFAAVAIFEDFEDFEEVVTGLGIERLKTPVIQDQQVDRKRYERPTSSERVKSARVRSSRQDGGSTMTDDKFAGPAKQDLTYTSHSAPSHFAGPEGWTVVRRWHERWPSDARSRITAENFETGRPYRPSLVGTALAWACCNIGADKYARVVVWKRCGSCRSR